MNIPAVNVQAIIAIVSFIAAVCVAKAVRNIYTGKWKAGLMTTLYLRVLLGFLLAAAMVIGYYSFAGIDVMTGSWR